MCLDVSIDDGEKMVCESEACIVVRVGKVPCLKARHEIGAELGRCERIGGVLKLNLFRVLKN